MSKFLKFIVNVFLIVAILVAVAILVPPFLGVSTTIVDTPAMKTNLPLGSVTYSRKVDVSTLEVGDEVLKDSGAATYAYVLTSVDPDTGKFGAVSATDPSGQEEEIILRNSVPKVVVEVPMIGYIVMAMQSLEGRLIIGLIVALIIILFALSELWKPVSDEDEIDEDEEEEEEEHTPYTAASSNENGIDTDVIKAAVEENHSQAAIEEDEPLFAPGAIVEGAYGDNAANDAEGSYDDAYAEGGYDDGAYAEGDYDNGAYAEGYDDGAYAEGGYDNGAYAEGDYDNGAYGEGYDDGAYAEGDYDNSAYADGYGDEAYADGAYEDYTAEGAYGNRAYAGDAGEDGGYADAYAEDAYEEGGYEEGAYEEGAYEGTEGSYESGSYAEGQYQDGAYAENDYQDDAYAKDLENTFESSPYSDQDTSAGFGSADSEDEAFDRALKDLLGEDADAAPEGSVDAAGEGDIFREVSTEAVEKPAAGEAEDELILSDVTDEPFVSADGRFVPVVRPGKEEILEGAMAAGINPKTVIHEPTGITFIDYSDEL